jgi:hypothetical protein
MKAHNDNLPILRRHPRLLAPHRDGNRERKAVEERKESADPDAGRELAIIAMRLHWLNLIELMLMRPNKGATANDDRQVGWPGRSGASKRFS